MSTIVQAGARLSDYRAELLGIDGAVADLGACRGPAPVGGHRQGAADRTRLVYLRYRRASLTGHEGDLMVAVGDAADAMAELGATPDLCLVQAHIDFKRHRLDDALRRLESCAAAAGAPEGRVLRADIDLEKGQYDRARRRYQSIIADGHTLAGLVRLAYVTARLGNPDLADEFYLEAEDEITAKEMRAYAWVELQRGRLRLGRGQYEQARRHYHQAGRAYSGYWLTEYHLAELLAAQGALAEAVAGYEGIVSALPRPDLEQAVGDLYQRMNRPDVAARWHQKALAGYLASVERGEISYVHHLADFYAEALVDGSEAVRWARRDVSLRDNASTQAMLAWALYRDGRPAEASDVMSHALSSGVVDSTMLVRASTISAAAGRADEAERLLDRAAQANPNYRDFRVHR